MMLSSGSDFGGPSGSRLGERASIWADVLSRLRRAEREHALPPGGKASELAVLVQLADGKHWLDMIPPEVRAPLPHPHFPPPITTYS